MDPINRRHWFVAFLAMIAAFFVRPAKASRFFHGWRWGTIKAHPIGPYTILAYFSPAHLCIDVIDNVTSELVYSRCDLVGSRRDAADLHSSLAHLAERFGCIAPTENGCEVLCRGHASRLVLRKDKAAFFGIRKTVEDEGPTLVKVKNPKGIEVASFRSARRGISDVTAIAMCAIICVTGLIGFASWQFLGRSQPVVVNPNVPVSGYPEFSQLRQLASAGDQTKAKVFAACWKDFRDVVSDNVDDLKTTGDLRNCFMRYEIRMGKRHPEIAGSFPGASKASNDGVASVLGLEDGPFDRTKLLRALDGLVWGWGG